MGPDVRYGRRVLERCPAAFTVAIIIVAGGRYDTEPKAILLADAIELWLSVLAAVLTDNVSRRPNYSG
jgi:hypothetical protein